MASYSRRRLLQIGGSAMCCGLAGCTQDTSTDDTLQLGRLSARNRDTQSHTVHVLIVQDDEPLYWQSREVPAIEGDTLGSISFEDYPSEPGESTLYARLDSNTFSERNRRQFSEYSASCLALAFSIEPTEQSDEAQLTIWRSFDTDFCQATSDSE